MNEEENVTITKKEYDKLKEAYEFLSALESAGVDNWDGYGDAWREVHPEEEDEDED